MLSKRKPYKRYTQEFKLEALRLLASQDKPASEIARELGIRRNQLYKWKEQLEKTGSVVSLERGRPTKEMQSDTTRLKERNRGRGELFLPNSSLMRTGIMHRCWKRWWMVVPQSVTPMVMI